MKKVTKIILSILFIMLASICFVALCKSLDRNLDILSWIVGCAFYMLGQILARWMYE